MGSLLSIGSGRGAGNYRILAVAFSLAVVVLAYLSWTGYRDTLHGAAVTTVGRCPDQRLQPGNFPGGGRSPAGRRGRPGGTPDGRYSGPGKILEGRGAALRALPGPGAQCDQPPPHRWPGQRPSVEQQPEPVGERGGPGLFQAPPGQARAGHEHFGGRRVPGHPAPGGCPRPGPDRQPGAFRRGGHRPSRPDLRESSPFRRGSRDPRFRQPAPGRRQPPGGQLSRRGPGHQPAGRRAPGLSPCQYRGGRGDGGLRRARPGWPLGGQLPAPGAIPSLPRGRDVLPGYPGRVENAGGGVRPGWSSSPCLPSSSSTAAWP